MISHLLSALAAAAVAPAGYQDLNLLDARVAEAVGGPGIAAPIDRRIKLAACPDAPEVAPAIGDAVAVRCPALGWKIRVPVNGAGSPASPTQLLVRKGDTVELDAEGAGYSVTYRGIALDEGAGGSVIRVKIPTSASPLSAIVSRAGVATISD